MNFPQNTTEQQIRGYCEEYGEIASLKIERSCEEAQQDYAIIIFSKRIEAQNCFKSLNGKLIGSQDLKVQADNPANRDPNDLKSRLEANKRADKTAKVEEKDANWIRNNVDEYNAMSAENQRQIIGRMMYKQVAPLVPAIYVPLVTGMLIDLEIFELDEILEILEDKSLLRDRMSEALDLLELE